LCFEVRDGRVSSALYNSAQLPSCHNGDLTLLIVLRSRVARRLRAGRLAPNK
jgi:hypothetical protein